MQGDATTCALSQVLAVLIIMATATGQFRWALGVGLADTNLTDLLTSHFYLRKLNGD